jgi:hypothetical protein
MTALASTGFFAALAISCMTSVLPCWKLNDSWSTCLLNRCRSCSGGKFFKTSF